MLAFVLIGILFAGAMLIWWTQTIKSGRSYAILAIAFFYILTALIGYFVYGLRGSVVSGFYDLGITNGQLATAARGFVLACVALVAGAILQQSATRRTKGGFNTIDQFSHGLSARLFYAILLISICFALLLIHGYGYEEIISRSAYIPEKNRLAKIIGTTFSPISMVALGYAYKLSSKKILRRIICAFIAVFIWMLFFSMASRRFAIAPTLFVMGAWVADNRSKSMYVALILSAVIAFLLIPIPITLRGLPRLGLSPFLDAIFSGQVNWSNLFTGLTNIFFSLPLAAFVERASSLNAAHLIMSITPLPGVYVGWYEVASQYRVNRYVPYSGIGELLNYGSVVLFIYYFVVGLIFSYAETWARRSSRFGRPLVLAFALFFALTSCQYNLRTTTRVVYYLVAMLFLLVFLPQIRRTRIYRN